VSAALLGVGSQLAAQAGPALTLDKKTLTLSAARRVVAASEAEATKRGLGVVIVVVDDAGTVIELTRMDSAQIASVNVGIGKARTAAIYRRPSRVLEEQIRDGRIAALALADAASARRHPDRDQRAGRRRRRREWRFAAGGRRHRHRWRQGDFNYQVIPRATV